MLACILPNPSGTHPSVFCSPHSVRGFIFHPTPRFGCCTHMRTRTWPGPGSGISVEIISVSVVPGLAYTTALFEESETIFLPI